MTTEDTDPSATQLPGARIEWRPQPTFEVISSLCESETLPGKFGLEVINNEGKVLFLEGVAGNDYKNGSQTNFGFVELARYKDTDDGEHSVVLFAKQATSDTGFTNSSLFLIERVASPDGEVRLGSTPGLLFRSAYPGYRYLRADDTPLTNALLTAFDSPDQLKDFIAAKQQSGQHTEDRSLDQRLERALRERTPEEKIDTSKFSWRYWNGERFELVGQREHRLQSEEQERRRRDERWAAAPPLRKLGAIAGWHFTHPNSRGRGKTYKDNLREV